MRYIYIYIYMIDSVTYLASSFTLDIFNQLRYVKLVGMFSQSSNPRSILGVLHIYAPHYQVSILWFFDPLWSFDELSTYCFQLLTLLDLPMTNPRLSRCNSMLLNEMWKPLMKGIVICLPVYSLPLKYPYLRKALIFKIVTRWTSLI